MRVLARPSPLRVGCVWGYRPVTFLLFLLPPFPLLPEVGVLKAQNFLEASKPALVWD